MTDLRASRVDSTPGLTRGARSRTIDIPGTEEHDKEEGASMASVIVIVLIAAPFIVWLVAASMPRKRVVSDDYEPPASVPSVCDEHARAEPRLPSEWGLSDDSFEFDRDRFIDLGTYPTPKRPDRLDPIDGSFTVDYDDTNGR